MIRAIMVRTTRENRAIKIRTTRATGAIRATCAIRAIN